MSARNFHELRSRKRDAHPPCCSHFRHQSSWGGGPRWTCSLKDPLWLLVLRLNVCNVEDGSVGSGYSRNRYPVWCLVAKSNRQRWGLGCLEGQWWGQDTVFATLNTVFPALYVYQSSSSYPVYATSWLLLLCSSTSNENEANASVKA